MSSCTSGREETGAEMLERIIAWVESDEWSLEFCDAPMDVSFDTWLVAELRRRFGKSDS